MKKYLKAAATLSMLTVQSLNLSASTAQTTKKEVQAAPKAQPKATTKKEVQAAPKAQPEAATKAQPKKEAQTAPKAQSKATSKKEAPQKKTNCGFKLYGNDRMQFVDEKDTIVKNIVVPEKCKNYTLHFEYKGKMKRIIMGHNVIITEEKDKEKVSHNALTSGVTNNYLPTSEVSSLVIASSTKLLGGGEEDFHKEDIVIDMSKVDSNKKYVFFCAFPGHALIMKGTFTKERAQSKKEAAPKKRAAPAKESQPAKKQKTK